MLIKMFVFYNKKQCAIYSLFCYKTIEPFSIRGRFSFFKFPKVKDLLRIFML